MKNNRNILIAVLSISAAVLLSLCVFVNFDSGKAYADSSVRGGDYIVVNGSNSSTGDYIYVVDVAAKQMAVYSTDRTKKSMEILDKVDLDKAFAD
ncbi:MAG: hypothetical protein EHM48_02485 [Planctomycetaceae bacterium]|nr:MAG: hypothetical protein EHM48_02485 [Planctomycetaceae bacterium]